MDALTGIIIVVALILLYIVYFSGEGFANKREKASFLHEWFSKNDPDYSRYKSEVPKSDVVEYTRIKTLKKSGDLNEDNILKVIS